MAMLSWDDFHEPSEPVVKPIPAITLEPVIEETPTPASTLNIVEAKRIVLCKEEILQLSPRKYVWAYEWWREQCDNHWLPYDVNLSKDIYQYKHELTPAQRHTFITVFATLTTSDVVAIRNIGSAIMRHIDAPEVCQALSRHGFDESVHSETYQHCIEALSLGEDEVYSLYKRVPAIAQKFAHAREQLKGLYIDKIETKEQLEEFVYSYIFFAMIFEGVWFYNGFSPIFALARTQLMLGTAEELQYIARDEIQHVALGANIIRTIIQENNIQLDYPRIRKMFKDAYDVNMTYIRYALREEWMGITVATYEQHERYMSNRRCRMLGIPVEELPFEPTEPSLTWLDEMNGHRKEKNFFETRVTEYRQGSSLEW